MDNKNVKNKKAIISFIFLILYIIVISIYVILLYKTPEKLNNGYFSILGILEEVFPVCGVIIGIVSLKEIKKKNEEGKELAMLGVIGPFVSFFLGIVLMTSVTTNRLKICKKATDCVKTSENYSKCKYEDKYIYCINEKDNK